VVVVDDMSTGHRDVVPADVALVEASIADTMAVRAALRGHDVTGVVHLAAKKAVAESVADPLLYWRENVDGMRNLVESMQAEGVQRIVYSSSAAVYGTPLTELVAEDTPLHPESPYGQTKVAGEWMLDAVAAATGMSYIALRYFNVAGAASPDLADRGAHNLIPLVLAALTKGTAPQVFGDDYPTRDGSCIRDYIHVVDLADAHVAAAIALENATSDDPRRSTYNVGRGEGVTVWEVIRAMQVALGTDFECVVTDRRPGDPVACAADATRIGTELGWHARLDLQAMVESAASAWRDRGVFGV
jgi:UDP-glucose 4-epimerase